METNQEKILDKILDKDDEEENYENKALINKNQVDESSINIDNFM